MINLNLFGEIYNDENNKTLTLVDTSVNHLLYLNVETTKKVLAYPIFVGDKAQMIYETTDRSKLKLLQDRKVLLEDNNRFSSISIETHRLLLHKRLNRFYDSIFEESIFDDFKVGFKLGWYDRFPTFTNQEFDIMERESFNRIFSGKKLNQDLIIEDDFIKVSVNKPYITKNKNIVIKRKPEDTLDKSDNTCITTIKFKTKSVKEIFNLVKEIELIKDYYSSEDYIKDVLHKVEFAKKLIDTESYTSPLMAHRILKVMSLAMSRCDIANKNKLSKDIVVNILLNNKSYFGDYMNYTSEVLGNDAMAYLRNIYVRSEYRMNMYQ